MELHYCFCKNKSLHFLQCFFKVHNRCQIFTVSIHNSRVCRKFSHIEIFFPNGSFLLCCVFALSSRLIFSYECVGSFFFGLVHLSFMWMIAAYASPELSCLPFLCPSQTWPSQIPNVITHIERNRSPQFISFPSGCSLIHRQESGLRGKSLMS
jgi:hypothetical protein